MEAVDMSVFDKHNERIKDIAKGLVKGQVDADKWLASDYLKILKEQKKTNQDGNPS